MAISAAYIYELDTDRDNTFDAAIDDISDYVLAANWNNGMSEAWDTVAQTARLTMTLNNASGAFLPENASSPYYGKVVRGVLIRIRATDPTTTDTTQMLVLKICCIQITPGEYSTRQVTLTAQDPSWEMLAADYNPPLLMDATADDVIKAALDSGAVIYPYHKNYWLVGVAGSSEVGTTARILDTSSFRNLDAGASVFPFTGDNTGGGGSQSVQAAIREVMEPEMGRFWWDVRAGKATFHNRRRDLLNDTIDLTLTASELMEPLDYRYQDDIVNKITVNYEPRTLGTPGSVLWSLDNTGISIAPGEVRHFRAHFSDPDAPGVPCGAKDVIFPTKGMDTYINNDPTGSLTFGDSWAIYTIGCSIGGAGADIWVYNTTYNIPVDLYVHKLQIRGTPIARHNATALTVQDGDSIAVSDMRETALSVPLLNDEGDASAYAGAVLRRYAESLARFNSVTFDAGQSAELLTAALTLTVGNQVTIQDGWTGHDKNYVIIGERHTVTGGALDNTGQQHASHVVTWMLKPKERDKGWRIGVEGYSELEETTSIVY